MGLVLAKLTLTFTPILSQTRPPAFPVQGLNFMTHKQSQPYSHLLTTFSIWAGFSEDDSLRVLFICRATQT